MNPLLNFDDLPLFDQIAPQHVAPAMDQLLADADAALAEVSTPGFPAEWAAVARTLDVATERLGRAWGAVNHLNSVADTPELRAAYNEALPRVTEFWTRLGASEALYAKYKAMDVAALNAEQRQAHKNAMRNFVLGGAELQGAARERFAEIQERQAEASQKFSENALDATDAYAYFATEDEMAGVPDDVKQAALAAAQATGHDGYKLTLKMPCYLPVMQFAHSSALRARLYRAYVTRGSDQARASCKSTTTPALIHQILALRQEEAQLLGYKNFGELSLVPKMAQSPQHVIDFLRDLTRRAKPYGEKDVADMRAFAKAELKLDDPQPWDWTYVGEKLKEARYAFNEQEVKQYFTAPKVLAGLFKIVETLFDVSIHKDNRHRVEPGRGVLPASSASCPPRRTVQQTWRLAARWWASSTWTPAPAPASAAAPGWTMCAAAGCARTTASCKTPVAHLVCNFAEGVVVDGVRQPPLLTHDDVITLFHEFGHGLHHLLSQVNEHDVSGISGVEWDAVELPSQFMENFCWEWDVLRHMTAHVDTGAPLPRALFDKMLAGKNYQSGMQTLRQIEFALFDMLLHTSEQPQADFMPLADAVRQEVAVVQPPAWNRGFHTFSHIFAGGYAAGYYSYKWAEVLSADAYAAFEETAGNDGLPNPQTGRKYRQTILEVGGSRPALESFKAFRGARAPAGRLAAPPGHDRPIKILLKGNDA